MLTNDDMSPSSQKLLYGLEPDPSIAASDDNVTACLIRKIWKKEKPLKKETPGSNPDKLPNTCQVNQSIPKQIHSQSKGPFTQAISMSDIARRFWEAISAMCLPWFPMGDFTR